MMKRIAIIIFAAFATLLIISKFGFVAAQSDEQITAFNEDISIKQSGTIDVTERITYDFDGNNRHGIFRTIPLVKTNTGGEKFSLDYRDLTVTDPSGNPYTFTQSLASHVLTVKIGDPNRTITGVHTYVIRYSLTGALTYFSDHDELYWNATGNEWEVPIQVANVSVTLPVTDSNEPLTAACFTGISGSTEHDCTAKNQPNSFTFAATRSLSPGEGLTIVAGFPKGIAAVIEPKKIVPFFDTFIGKILGIIFIIFAIFLALGWYIGYPIWIAVTWYRHGRDPKPAMGVTRAWYSPPTTKAGRKLPPGETAALVHQSADREDITATLVDLARRGYFTIVEKTKGDFWFTKKAVPKGDEPLLPYEQHLYTALFEDGGELQLKGADLVSTVTETKQKINSQLVTDELFYEDPAKIRLFYAVVAVAGLFTFNIPLLFSASIFGRSLPKRTLAGAQAEAVARSLRNFLASQDKKLAFQADKQMMFEKLLPYAIAFGIEKIWAKRFEHIHLKKPDWYDSYSGGQFNSILFVNSLNSTSKSFITAATPTSSSSGFSSGFSGGSSGGGGGGGGGGSW